MFRAPPHAYAVVDGIVWNGEDRNLHGIDCLAAARVRPRQNYLCLLPLTAVAKPSPM